MEQVTDYRACPDLPAHPLFRIIPILGLHRPLLSCIVLIGIMIQNMVTSFVQYSLIWYSHTDSYDLVNFLSKTGTGFLIMRMIHI